MGVLIYALVSCNLPYPYPNDKLADNVERYAAMLKSKLEFKGDNWLFISETLKDLLIGMLEKDPAKRLTIDGVLNHAWFKDKAL